MAQNEFFLRRLADILGISILKPKVAESTAFGVACLAGLGRGAYRSLDDIAKLWKSELRCEPQLGEQAREREMAGWRAAVARARSG